MKKKKDQEVSISVRDVVKEYKVRHEKGRTLKEAFLRQGIYSETKKALDHVSFEVVRGSTIGLIGSNGSGKSTMLKLIAGTSKPNSGEVVVSGRVSALLELGAGFHPDFSGRENVYLDGIILGLTRREIDKRFDDIVRFAEMEEFIDAPAKTYSSGMYMRLAFSVAVSVDPDILLIDEVLAVGDESFQRKCLARINEFKNQGKTIFFVSHSLGTVRDLCDEVVWLDRGVLRAQGGTDKVIDQYLESVLDHDEARISDDARISAEAELETPAEEDENRWGTHRAEMTEVKILGKDGGERHLFNSGDYLKVAIHYKSYEEIKSPIVGITVRTMDGTECCGTSTLVLGKAPSLLPEDGMVEFVFDDLPLLPGAYTFTVSLAKQEKGKSQEMLDYHYGKYPFTVVGGRPGEKGICHVPYRWLNWPDGK